MTWATACAIGRRMSSKLVVSLLPAVALSLVALAIFLTGCGTTQNVLTASPKGSRVFGGVRYDAESAVQCVARPAVAKGPEGSLNADKTPESGSAADKAAELRPYRWAEFLTSIIDAPFSIVGDTLTLPWVLYVRVQEFADRHKQAEPAADAAEKTPPRGQAHHLRSDTP